MNRHATLVRLASDCAAEAAAHCVVALQAQPLFVPEHFAPVLVASVDAMWNAALSDAEEAWRAFQPEIAEITFRTTMAQAGVDAVKTYLEVQK